MAKIIQLCKMMISSEKEYFLNRKFQLSILFMVLPVWILYTTYYTYYDETTKNAVIKETEHIVNYVGNGITFEYKNNDKIIVFRSEIYINMTDVDSVDRYRKFLAENGYKKVSDVAWVKNKYTIIEEYTKEFIIVNVEYVKDKIQ